MKNNFLFFIFACFFLNNVASSNELFFETEKIEIYENGNLIKADNGSVSSENNDLLIQAEKFEYNKLKGELKVFGEGSVEIKNKELKIFFENSILDLKKNTISTVGFLELIKNKKKFLIKSDLIIYEKNNNFLFSNNSTTLEDEIKNYFQVKNFHFDIDKGLIKFNDLLFKDINSNIFKTSLAYLNINSGKLIGKDLKLDLFKTNNSGNEPRLKGNSFKNDNYFTEIQKGIFTNCKKREDGKCPPWKISADKIQHDKLKKQINYKNAKLYLYDIPVIYFPKFFHPDPTVKRQSGFLIPSLNTSNNSSNYLNIPYYFVLAENKDVTFTPRIYSNNNLLMQTEFRQKNLNTSHISEFSFYKNNKLIDENHLLYEYNKRLKSENFEFSEISYKLQQTSNDTYLKKNKIESKLISDVNVLENSIKLNLSNNNFSLDAEATSFEKLTKDNNDKYEYIFPKINLTREIENNTKLDGNFYFKSDNLIRNYDTNVLESSNINNLLFSSSPRTTNSGYLNNYEFVLKNSNTNSKNSKNFKDDENLYISGLFQYNSSKPLIKRNIKHQQILEPKMSLKFAPDHTKNYSDEDNLINVDQLFLLNRINKNDTTEGGVSLAYGANYSLQDNSKQNQILNFKFSNNIRLKENDDINKTNQLNKKMSNIFTETIFSPNEFFNIKYNNAIKNNFSEISNEEILSKIQITNFSFLFDYLNENTTTEQNSYLSRTFGYKMNSSSNLKFIKREDKSKDLTEFYKIIYEYRNDCLIASVDYNKNFYNDRDINPEENIFFKLTILPFGQANSPNLKN